MVQFAGSFFNVRFLAFRVHPLSVKVFQLVTRHGGLISASDSILVAASGLSAPGMQR